MANQYDLAFVNTYNFRSCHVGHADYNFFITRNLVCVLAGVPVQILRYRLKKLGSSRKVYEGRSRKSLPTPPSSLAGKGRQGLFRPIGIYRVEQTPRPAQNSSTKPRLFKINYPSRSINITVTLLPFRSNVAQRCNHLLGQ